MNYLIGYRDDDNRVRYYHGVNGATSRAIVGSKKSAPRFDEAMGGVVMRQLPAVDNRDWQMVEDAPRCRFE